MKACRFGVLCDPLRPLRFRAVLMPALRKALLVRSRPSLYAIESGSRTFSTTWPFTTLT